MSLKPKFIGMIGTSLLIIAAYAVTWLLGRVTGAAWLTAVPGLIILYYLPGHLFNEIIVGKKNQLLGWYGRFSLDIAASIALLALIYLRLKPHLNYQAGRLIWLVIIVNLVLVGAVWLWQRRRSNLPAKINWSEFWLQNRFLIAVFALPIVLFLIRALINPYIAEIDDNLYLTIYQDIIHYGQTFSFIDKARPAFPFFMMATKYVAGISAVGLLKFIGPVLFYLTAPISYVFCRRITNKHLAALAYLLILASPILVIMNERVRPETFVFVFALPTLVLSYLAISESDIVLALVAVVFGLATLRFHELGLFLLVAGGVSLVATGCRLLIKNWRLIRSNPGKSILIALPYLVLASMFAGKFQQSLPTYYLNNTFPVIKERLLHLTWRWWFISDYTNVDGARTTLPGINGLYYYLYNGLFLLVAIVVLSLVVLRLKPAANSAQPSRSSYWAWLPIGLFLAIYLAIGELLPRLNIALLPTRAWPYIMLSLILIGPFLVARILNNLRATEQQRWTRFLMWGLGFVVATGVIGTFIGALFIGNVVQRPERAAIKALRALEPNAVIVSTQVNNTLVTTYGGHDFLRLTDGHSYDQTEAFRSELLTAANTQIGEDLNNIATQQVSVQTTTSSSTLVNGIPVASTGSAISLTNWEAVGAVLQKFDPNQYRFFNDRVNKLQQMPDAPLYFFYSFVKVSGISGRSSQWVELNDGRNKNFFDSYNGPGLVTKNDQFILIKLF